MNALDDHSEANLAQVAPILMKQSTSWARAIARRTLEPELFRSRPKVG